MSHRPVRTPANRWINEGKLSRITVLILDWSAAFYPCLRVAAKSANFKSAPQAVFIVLRRQQSAEHPSTDLELHQLAIVRKCHDELM